MLTNYQRVGDLLYENPNLIQIQIQKIEKKFIQIQIQISFKCTYSFFFIYLPFSKTQPLLLTSLT